jgi:hypothetical protein
MSEDANLEATGADAGDEAAGEYAEAEEEV